MDGGGCAYEVEEEGEEEDAEDLLALGWGEGLGVRHCW